MSDCEIKIALPELQALIETMAVVSSQMMSLQERMDAIETAIGLRNGQDLADGTGIEMFIALQVCMQFRLSMRQLLGSRRPGHIAWPRQIAMYLVRKHTRYSLGDIGHFFGDRDHGTVLHACRLVPSRCSVDAQTKLIVDKLSSTIEDALTKRIKAQDTNNAVNNNQNERSDSEHEKQKEQKQEQQ